MLDFSNTKLQLRRPLTSYPKVQALIGVVTRNRHLFANIKKPGCYLDIGCGQNIDPHFCNIDFSWKPGIDVCWDVTKGLPLPDTYVSGIFTEHMIEHLSIDATMTLLNECKRILKPGGILRIVVPDGELYLNEYAKHRAGEIYQMPYVECDRHRFPFVTAMVSVNRIFREHGHRFIWDFETLRLALIRCGFSTVERCSFGQGADPKLARRDTASRRVESLYVEATQF